LEYAEIPARLRDDYAQFCQQNRLNRTKCAAVVA
jgi:hypothetical protein